MKHIYFIRHGTSEMNVQGLYSGQTESPLTAEGREQAKRAGQAAKDLSIDYIVASPLGRTLETARIIAEQIGYPVDTIDIQDLLIERHFGSMEGQTWTPEFDIDTVADAETHEALEARVTKVWQYLQGLPAENILVVSHGSTGRMLRHVLNSDIPFKGSVATHHLPNGEIVEFIVK